MGSIITFWQNWIICKKKIGQELDKLTGRKIKNVNQSEKGKKELNPSSEGIYPYSKSKGNEKQLPDIYKPKKRVLDFLVIFFNNNYWIFFIGILKTFENDLINYFPEIEYIYMNF